MFVNIVHLIKIHDFVYITSLSNFEQCTVVLVHAMRAYKRVQVYLCPVLILRLCMGEWSASHPTRFNLRGKSTRHTSNSRSVWTLWKRNQFLAPAGIQSWVLRRPVTGPTSYVPSCNTVQTTPTHSL